MRHDSNYRFLRTLANCRAYDFNLARSGRAPDKTIVEILLNDVRTALPHADKRLVKMTLGH